MKLSYISKGNAKVSFTNRSLTQKSYILQTIFPHRIFWYWIDHSILELVSAKHSGFDNWRYLICDGIMGFPNTLIKQSVSLDNINDMSVKSQPKKYRLEDY